MTPKRPKELKFIGNRFPDGRPERYIEGIPSDDIGPDETDALTQEQLSTIRASGLYREVAQPEPKKSGGTKKAAATKPAEAPATESDAQEPMETGGDTPPAGETARESEA